MTAPTQPGATTTRDPATSSHSPDRAPALRSPSVELDDALQMLPTRANAIRPLTDIPLALGRSGWRGTLVIEPAARFLVTAAVTRTRRSMSRFVPTLRGFAPLIAVLDDPRLGG